ncbi:TolC family protein [Niabella sp. W65]|nr:TolC family protein [Niabella sp. W65]MCH7364051.1 TolC family protein [Niabella sp. W65]ULT39927.1 TolC family protein [Niabella sp. I65]
MWAQDSVWTLEQCIAYAKEHNLTVRQSEWDKRLAQMIYESSRYSHLPNLNISSNYGWSFGRSINPATNQFENTQFSSLGLSASSDMLVFGWFQKRYNIQKNELAYQKAGETTRQQEYELVLTIVTAYLRALLAKEQISNLLFQIELSNNNKIRIEKLLGAGRSNILELSQSQNQLANDSSLYYQAVLNYELALIDLKVILNLALDTPLALEMKIEEGDIVFMEKPYPEDIYKIAVEDFPTINQADIEMDISKKISG